MASQPIDAFVVKIPRKRKKRKIVQLEQVEHDEQETSILSLACSDCNPSGCRWVTIGHGDIDVTEDEWKSIGDFLQKKGVEHGLIAYEKGKERGHMHCHAAFITHDASLWKNLPRDVKKHLKWGKSGTVNRHNKTWTEAYTWQNLAGGYAQKDSRVISWGLSKAYLNAGKIAYTAHVDMKKFGLELTPYNYMKIVCAHGKRFKCKTFDQAIHELHIKGYGVARIARRVDVEAARVDYLSKVWGEKATQFSVIDLIMRPNYR